jgi:DNA-binding transcriptional regulator YdaS (Cro superfamily)
MDSIERLTGHLARREPAEPGQQTRLAAHLGVSQGLVWQWLNRRTPIAAKHGRGIEEYTAGEVTRFMVAPQVFGAPPPEEHAAPSIDELLSHILRDDERTAVRLALGTGPAAAVKAIEALDVAVSVREQLLKAANLAIEAAR